MQPYKFVFVDQSTLQDAAHGGPLTTEILTTIGSAVAKQMNCEVHAEWGCSVAGPVSFRVGSADGKDVQADEIGLFILDSLPAAPGAAAYHDRLSNGAPVGYFAREDYTSHTSGSSSLSVDVSHECIETCGDPGANRWADLASGTQDAALELCDPVQNVIYEVDGIAVSDFVLQSYFDPGAAGPFDHLGKCPAGGDYSGGYLIVRTEDQASTDEQPGKRGAKILGSPRATQKAAHASSRRSRRTLGLVVAS